VSATRFRHRIDQAPGAARVRQRSSSCCRRASISAAGFPLVKPPITLAHGEPRVGVRSGSSAGLRAAGIRHGLTRRECRTPQSCHGYFQRPPVAAWPPLIALRSPAHGRRSLRYYLSLCPTRNQQLSDIPPHANSSTTWTASWRTAGQHSLSVRMQQLDRFRPPLSTAPARPTRRMDGSAESSFSRELLQIGSHSYVFIGHTQRRDRGC